MANIEGSLAEMTIESEYLKDRISLSIYLPANYTPLKSYHLMICQDGQDFFDLDVFIDTSIHLLARWTLKK